MISPSKKSNVLDFMKEGGTEGEAPIPSFFLPARNESTTKEAGGGYSLPQTTEMSRRRGAKGALRGGKGGKKTMKKGRRRQEIQQIAILVGVKGGVLKGKGATPKGEKRRGGRICSEHAMNRRDGRRDETGRREET